MVVRKVEGLTERNVFKLSHPFGRVTGEDNEFEYVDHLTDGGLLMYQKHARHGFFRFQAVIKETAHGIDIMSQQDIAPLGGEFQHAWIVCPSDLGILYADKVGLWDTPPNPT